MRLARRLGSVAAVVLGLLVPSAIVAGLILVYRPHPVVDADLRLLGLRERGEILRDRWGVPHIHARNAHDLFFLQGYALAQDRLFQMDLYRRAAHGRLSEVFGDRTLDADRLMRTLTLGHAARRDEALLGPDGRAAAEAFAEGVNKFLQQHGESLPLEFILLGYRPELWSPVDSLAVMKLQAYDQAINYETELLRVKVAQRLGAGAVTTLFPEPAGTPALEPAWRRIAPHLGTGPATRPAGADVLHALLGDSGPGAGSNCLAVAGSRTASGRPLLAADPHLGVRNPSIWYELGLHGAGYRVVGFTIPGVPGVILGHNDRIAWGLTVAFVDQQDLYLERRDPADARRFLFRGGSEAATVHREMIVVKGRARPVPHEVEVTRHGPILTPVLPGQSAPLALRWTALDGGTNLDGILALDRARDWDSFRAALALVEGPALTLCYADVEGRIGRALAGRVPLRVSAEDGRLPLPGWTGEHEWRDPLPAAQNPAALETERGFVVAANQRWADLGDAGSPAEWDPGFRALRAVELLQSRRDLAANDLRLFQGDLVSPPVRRFRPLLEGTAGGSARAARAREIVRAWDGVLGSNSAGAAIHQSFVFHLLARTFQERLGEPLFASYVADARATFALHELVARPDDPWFAGRPLAGLAAAALEDAAAELERRLGSDPARWRWGAVHRITFAHPLGGAIPFGVLNNGPHDRPGDDDTLDDAPYDPAKPYAVKTHASLRTVVDLGDLDRSWSILPTGQSGQPGSRNWGDQTALWLRGELKPMPLSRERLDGPVTRLVLRAR